MFQSTANYIIYFQNWHSESTPQWRNTSQQPQLIINDRIPINNTNQVPVLVFIQLPPIHFSL